MSAATFIKFCAIGALSATGTRPYRDGADGFVMGEGAGLMLLKRLADAERDGDRIYAVVRGIAGSSDGQAARASRRPTRSARSSRSSARGRSRGSRREACGLIEGHGTSTRVGDVVELTALAEVFASAGLAPGTVPIGSVKSNIGHLKGAAGAAGLLKAALALHHKVLPPSLGGEPPNPNLDWSTSPFAISTELRDWEARDGRRPASPASARSASAGRTSTQCWRSTCPDASQASGNGSIAVRAADPRRRARTAARPPRRPPARPGRRRRCAERSCSARTTRRGSPRSCATLGATAPRAGDRPARPAALRAPERIAIDYGDAGELQAKAALALKALEGGGAAAWKALRARGIFRGSGPAAEGRVPLHRAGIAVREHARAAARMSSRSSRRPSPRPTR